MELQEATADLILGCDDLVKERVDLPEWGVYLYIRTMTGAERDAWEASLINMTPKRVNGRNVQDPTPNLQNARAKLISKLAVNGKGEAIFSKDQVIALGKKSAKALDRCFDVAKRLNHFTSDDVEELAKN